MKLTKHEIVIEKNKEEADAFLKLNESRSGRCAICLADNCVVILGLRAYCASCHMESYHDHITIQLALMLKRNPKILDHINDRTLLRDIIDMKNLNEQVRKKSQARLFIIT